jgi:hypothetical protein
MELNRAPIAAQNAESSPAQANSGSYDSRTVGISLLCNR